MTKRDKTRAKIAAAGRNVRFDELDSFLAAVLGAKARVPGTSHHTYQFPDGRTQTIPRPKRSFVLPVYLKALDANLRRNGL